MAKPEVTAKAAKTAASTEEKKATSTRTNAELKKTEEGKIVVVLRTAMALANTKEREGLNVVVSPTFLDEAGKEVKKTKEEIAKDGGKKLAGMMNTVLREGGKLSAMDKKGEEYAKLKALAIKALPDLKASNYSANVKALLTFCLESISTVRTGFNPSILEDITL